MKTVLKYRPDNSFRIAQLTDLALSTYPYSREDQETLALLQEAVACLDVDLFVITGNLVDSRSINNVKPVYQDVFAYFQAAQLPLAITYGTYDSLAGTSRQMLREFEQGYLDPLIDKKDCHIIDDRESYRLEIWSQDESQLMNHLYFIDSGGLSPVSISEFAWVEPSQVSWFYDCSQQDLPLKVKHKTDMVFQHMPIPEYYQADIISGQHHHVEPFDKDEGLNTGLFAAMYLAGSVHSMYAGHYGNSNFVSYYHGIQLNHGLVSGYGNFSSLQRGVRIIEILPEGIQSYTLARQDFSREGKIN